MYQRGAVAAVMFGQRATTLAADSSLLPNLLASPAQLPAASLRYKPRQSPTRKFCSDSDSDSGPLDDDPTMTAAFPPMDRMPAPCGGFDMEVTIAMQGGTLTSGRSRRISVHGRDGGGARDCVGAPPPAPPPTPPPCWSPVLPGLNMQHGWGEGAGQRRGQGGHGGGVSGDHSSDVDGGVDGGNSPSGGRKGYGKRVTGGKRSRARVAGASDGDEFDGEAHGTAASAAGSNNDDAKGRPRKQRRRGPAATGRRKSDGDKARGGRARAGSKAGAPNTATMAGAGPGTEKLVYFDTSEPLADDAFAKLSACANQLVHGREGSKLGRFYGSSMWSCPR